MTKNPHRLIEDIRKDLADGGIALGHAEMTTEAARREETACRNRVNELQKEFDAAVEAMRKDPAFKGTDWAAKPSRYEAQ